MKESISIIAVVCIIDGHLATNKNISKWKVNKNNENTQNIDNIVETNTKMTEDQSSLNQGNKELVYLLINLLKDSKDPLMPNEQN